MNPVGKIVKLLLALTVAAAVVAGATGCKKDDPGPAPAAEVKAQVKDAKPAGPKTLEIKVTEAGYEPSPVTLKKGEPVTLKVTRTTDATCANEFILDEHGINQKLPLNETVTVQFTPDKSGELKYGCAMGKMISGRFLVE